MTPLEAAAIAYVAAVRRQEPGTTNEAYRALADKADAVEKRTPSSASKLPDAHAVAEKAQPRPEELVGVDHRRSLTAAREALARRAPSPESEARSG